MNVLTTATALTLYLNCNCLVSKLIQSSITSWVVIVTGFGFVQGESAVEVGSLEAQPVSSI